MSVEAIKAMLTEERIIEAVETDSHYHEIQDHDVPVRRQHSSREATLRTGTADSLPHRGSSGTLGPNFRLNAPAPDDGEDDVHVDPPPNSEPSEGQTRHVSMASDDEPRLNAPASDGVALVVSTPDEDVVSTPDEEIRQLNHFEMAQVDMSHKPDWAIGRRRWKVEWLTIASLSTLLLAAIIVIIVLALNQSTSSETKAATKPPVVPTNPSVPKTLDLIKARGILACGVVPYAGFSMLDNSTGSWSGFEIDLCRAVGAAIFGEGDHVNYTASTNEGRFSLLQSSQVDLLAAGATYTMQRDVYEPTAGAGLTFSVPYLYDGVSFAGVPKFVECADQRSTTGNCTGLRICVQSNTTHVQVVESLFPDPSVTLVSPTTPAFYSNFVLGYCNVLAGEQFDLAITNVRQAGYNGNYSFSSNLYSKEPIALVTRDDDVEWSDFVNWVFLALLTAETKTIFQTTAQATVNNPAPIVDLAQLPFYAAVAEVGNYGEVYARYLQTIVPRAPANELNNGSTPLIYSFPFGNTSTLGPGPVVNGTLEKILKRGYLLCGTAETLFFANFNSTAQEWEGFDVDYCRAVSAAVFNGTGSTVFVPITDTDRWEKLVNGDIDLISWDTTWNYQRDVDEPSTNTGFTFTQPDFYSGLQFGGTPSYETCAETINVQGHCANLKICVKNGTTILDALGKLFVQQYIGLEVTDQQVIDCLGNGQGNVIAGDGFFTAPATVIEQGYTGAYQTSSSRFSRENLAVVTTQDDPQWSSFVNWVVIASFYAEEQNITQATYLKMSTTNIFGQEFTGMLQNAILAVGSHSEILTRHTAGKHYDIGAINGLNTNPYGPQHFPPGGLFDLY